MRVCVCVALLILLCFVGVSRAQSPRLISYISSRAGNTDWANPESPYTHYVLSFLVNKDEDDPFNFITAGGWTNGTLEFNKTSGISDSIHAAGKKVMLGFGGGTMDWRQYRHYAGREAELAQVLADAVVNNKLDGIDVDWEDTAAFTRPDEVGYDGRLFLINLTSELRLRLPEDKYEISHAPQPPYLSANGGAKIAGYNDVLEAVGDKIDFLNMQYYNNGGFQTPREVVRHYTSVVDADLIEPRQLLVGKPVTPTNAGQGYVPVERIAADIVVPLREKYGEEFGGVFNWEFKSDANPNFAWGQAVAEQLFVPEPSGSVMFFWAFMLAAFGMRMIGGKDARRTM